MQEYPTMTADLPWREQTFATGVALVAGRDFQPGERVGGFEGRISRVMAQHTLQILPGLHVDLRDSVGLLAHGCAPNCVLDMQALELLAIRPIRTGERLTVDYAQTEDRLFRQFACHCGAAECRRWIAGRREPIAAEGLAYLARLTTDRDATAETAT